MKTSKASIYKLAQFLSLLLLIQSCASTYYRGYTLHQAVITKRKAIVVTESNVQIKYERIDTLNGNYIGFIPPKSTGNYEIIDPQTVRDVKVTRNQKGATEKNLSTLAIIAGAALLIALVISGINNIDLSSAE